MEFLENLDYSWLTKFAVDFYNNLDTLLPILYVVVLLFFTFYAVKSLTVAASRFWRAVNRSLRIQAIIACAQANRQRVSEGPRMHPVRERAINRLIANGLVDTLEHAEYLNNITREEKLFAYRRMANILNVESLLPRGEKTLKQELKAKQFAKQGKAFVPTEKKVTATGPLGALLFSK